MSIYQRFNTLYKSLFSESFRQWLDKRSPWPIRALKKKATGLLKRTAKHDDVYTAEYFADSIDIYMKDSAGPMVDSIMADFKPRTAIDVGCGTGYLLSTLKERGVTCHGYEYATAAVEICRSRGLEVTQFNIMKDEPKPDVVDVAICTEVAEHIPAEFADRLVKLLCSMSRRVVFTAATPGQGGTDHINEQPHEYWIAKFNALGYQLAKKRTADWGAAWSTRGVTPFFYANLMIFENVA